VAAALLAAAQLAPAQYNPQYAALLAPLLAGSLGIALARLPGVAVAAGAVLLAGAAVHATASFSAPDVAAAVQRVVPSGACTVTDSPRLLVTADRLSGPGCGAAVDPYGATLADGPAPGVWQAELRRAAFIVADAPFASWYSHPDASLRAYVEAHFEIRREGGLIFYVRRG
jgi:hypothetical protein